MADAYLKVKDTNGTLSLVREESDASVADLINAIGVLPVNSPTNLYDGLITSSNGKWASINSGNYRYAILPVKGGESIYANTDDLEGNAGIAALRSYSQPTTGDTPDFSTESDWNNVVIIPTNTEYIGTIPADARFLYVYCGSTLLNRIPKKILIDDYDYTNSITHNIQEIILHSKDYEKNFEYEKPLAIPLNKGYYWNTEQTTASLTAYASYSASEPIPASPGKTYHAIIYTGGSAKSHAVICADQNYSILASYRKSTGTQDYEFIAPPNTAYILITKGSADNEPLYYHPAELYEKKIAGVDYINDKLFGPYTGKYISILGDSISSFAGDIPTASLAYYTGDNAGVTYSTQMWYNVLARMLGMKLLRNQSWSGSCVTSGVRNDTTYKPASDPSRCENLHSGSIMPDVIIVAMGVNDYTYMQNISQFGTWDGTTALGTASDLSDYATGDFKSAYASMLARIIKKYPDAEIICLTPWFVERGATDTGVTYLNTIGKQEHDYALSIREIANIMNVRIVEAGNIGFNRYNFYPTYAEDSSSNPTHPNAEGQRIMGIAIAKAMLNEA